MITERLEFEACDNNKEYEVEDICNNAVYTRKLEVGYLLGFYYLVSGKSYLKDKRTWEPASAM